MSHGLSAKVKQARRSKSQPGSGVRGLVTGGRGSRVRSRGLGSVGGGPGSGVGGSGGSRSGAGGLEVGAQRVPRLLIGIYRAQGRGRGRRMRGRRTVRMKRGRLRVSRNPSHLSCFLSPF